MRLGSVDISETQSFERKPQTAFSQYFPAWHGAYFLSTSHYCGGPNIMYLYWYAVLLVQPSTLMRLVPVSAEPSQIDGSVQPLAETVTTVPVFSVSPPGGTRKKCALSKLPCWQMQSAEKLVT